MTLTKDKREALEHLLERVKGMKGPSAVVGREVLAACGWKQTVYGHFHGPLTMWFSPDGKVSFDDDQFAAHDPTRSVDAALALVEREFPGRHVAMQTGDNSRPFAVISATWHAQASTLPLAIIAATLSAKLETGREGE